MKAIFRSHARDGFTLVELLIAMTIFSIITGVVVMLLFTTTNFYDVSSVDAKLNLISETALNQITSELTKVYRDQLTFGTVGTQYIISYTVPSQVDGSLNPPKIVYDAASFKGRFIWDPSTEDLVFDSNGTLTTLIGKGNVSGLSVEFITNGTETRHIVFMTLKKPLSDGTISSKVYRKEFYILPPPK
ncbi:MAG: prepilin-type N-terminal cleavage/methylation domain-containing protein [Planctomycetota bacterium]|nr:MAG: prepilin-type N-terminal cleavage/methylation domain-containing protein [Planctomycetota bacterium]